MHLSFSVWRLALGWALASLPFCAFTAGIDVTPTRVELSLEDPIAALKLRNPSDSPQVVQVQLKEWRQVNGQDEYAPVRDPLATPPIAKMAPRSAQTIRVGMMRPTPSSIERSYRLFIREVPPPAREGFRGLQIAFELSIPVFIKPQEAIDRKVTWQLLKGEQGQFVLSAVNEGNVHVQMLHFTLKDQTGDVLLDREVFHYLLPKQKFQWQLRFNKTLKPDDKVSMLATTDEGNLRADLRLLAP